MFGNQADLDVLVQGVALAHRIIESKPMDSSVIRRIMPDAVDVDWDRYLRDTAWGAHHPAGTCEMGEGPDCVVDSSLSVRGVDGVRVVDNSIMPTLPSGNTNAPAVMIAERAADLILARAQNRHSAS